MPSIPPWVPQGNGLGRDLCQALQSLTHRSFYCSVQEKIHFFFSDRNAFCLAYRIQALLESDIIELMNTIF